MVKTLQIATNRFISDVYVNNSIQTSVQQITPAYDNNAPGFFYTGRNTNGQLIGSSDPNAVQGTWWNCVKNEYNKLCGNAVWKTIVCGAAIAGAPEIVAIAFGGLMIGCAW